MKDAVVHGYGMVGKATAHAFEIVEYTDLKESTVSIKDSSDLRYHFICLPTPVENHVYDIRPILNLMTKIVREGKENIFILRSTVLPGTCRTIASGLGIDTIVHAPEFLSESTWRLDTDYPDQVVIGGDDERSLLEVVALYAKRYPGIGPLITDTPTAELIKCAINAFFSTKVIFANELYEIARRAGADYDLVKSAMYGDSRIGENHLSVYYKRPSWDKPKRGLHGKCLPKDLEALTHFSGSKLLGMVRALNEVHTMRGEKWLEGSES